MADRLQPRDAKEVEAAVQWVLAEGKALELVGAGLEARHRPAGADRPYARSLHAHGSDALRARRAGAVRQGRYAARRDRGAGGREGPAARLRADGLRPDPRRRRRYHRRRAGGESVRSAPDQGGRRARPFPRLLGRVRARRDLQIGGPGGEERHRLRSLQADGWLLGHARGDDRGDHQDAAQARDGGDAWWCAVSSRARRLRR